MGGRTRASRALFGAFAEHLFCSGGL